MSNELPANPAYLAAALAAHPHKEARMLYRCPGLEQCGEVKNVATTVVDEHGKEGRAAVNAMLEQGWHLNAADAKEAYDAAQAAKTAKERNDENARRIADIIASLDGKGNDELRQYAATLGVDMKLVKDSKPALIEAITRTLKGA